VLLAVGVVSALALIFAQRPIPVAALRPAPAVRAQGSAEQQHADEK
jgi:hypothetical protein